NEAHRLPTLLASLERLDSPVSEVLVVDDGSTDGTGEVARAARCTVLRLVDRLRRRRRRSRTACYSDSLGRSTPVWGCTHLAVSTAAVSYVLGAGATTVCLLPVLCRRRRQKSQFGSVPCPGQRTVHPGSQKRLSGGGRPSIHPFVGHRRHCPGAAISRAWEGRRDASGRATWPS